MAILRESPWYQEILAEGEQRGLKQAARQYLMRILRQRFGEIPPEVEVSLEGESVEKLESLMDSALAVNSLEEFLSILSI